MTTGFEQVEFVSEGATLRGRLYRRLNTKNDLPVVVMAHGFSCLADYLDETAAEIAKRGFAVLVFDHRNFGRSDGEPRFGFDGLLQLRGYRDAISFAETLPGIDQNKIATWGESATTLTVQFLGAFDNRVKAVIAHTPICGTVQTEFDTDSQKFDWIRENWSSLDLETVPARQLPVRVCDFDEGEGQVILNFQEATDYYMRARQKYASNWSNQVLILQRKLEAQLNEQRLPTKYLQVPTLFVIATDDQVPNCELATNRKCFEMITAPKHKVEISGGHFGLLESGSDQFKKVTTADVEFLQGVFSAK